MITNQHAATLRDMAEREDSLAKSYAETAPYVSAAYERRAAALLAGAEALEAVEVAKAALQAEAWRIFNCTWTMDGKSVYRILLADQHAVATAYKAALARLEGK
jgi:hypothetical protein